MTERLGTATNVSGRGFHLAICLGIALLVALIYGQVAQHDFVRYDDPLYIHEKPIVLRGLSVEGVVWAFRHGAVENYWTPITWLSHMLDVQLFGLDAGKHHLTSVVLHAMAAMVLYGALLALTAARWPSAMVAVLWAVHPLHVESVAWIAERKDTLSALFAFAVMWAYARHARKRTWLWYAAVLLLFALALMCKPMVVTLPAVLLLLDFWPLKRAESWRVLVLEKAPLIALTVAIGVITVMAQHQVGTVRTVEQFPIGFRLANAVVSLARYLAKTFWPAKLAVFYPPPASWPVVMVIVSAVVLGAITVLAIALRRTRPYVLVGWLWFVGMLVPVIGVLQVGRQAMADRYTYLPHVGLFVAIVWTISALLPRRALIALGVVCTLALSVVTINQVRHWRNTETLFTHALAVTRDNDVAHQQIANVLVRQNKFEQAEEHYRAAIAINPQYALARANLGNLLVRSRRFEEAVEQYEAALRGMVAEPGAIYLGLAIALTGAKQYERADEAFTQAAHHDPKNAAVFLAWGLSLKERGDAVAAQEKLRAALELNPRLPQARQALAELASTRPSR